MKLNLIISFAALALGSSLVLAAPVDYDMQELAARESYDIEDLMAREYFNEQLEARDDELEDVFAREVCVDLGFLFFSAAGSSSTVC